MTSSGVNDKNWGQVRKVFGLTENETKLGRYARLGHLSGVQEMLDAGTDPNSNNCNPLWESIMGRHLEVFRCLLKHGADIDCLRGACLIECAKSSNPEFVEYLVFEKHYPPSTFMEMDQVSANVQEFCKRLVDMMNLTESLEKSMPEKENIACKSKV